MFVEQEAIENARKIDLLTYLQKNDPQNLIRLGTDIYCVRNHDSLKISNGKWYWFTRRIGGVSALDYLIKVENYTLPDAIVAILGSKAVHAARAGRAKLKVPKKLLLPEVEENPAGVVEYLRQRGIELTVINYCLEHRLLFETSQHHNAMFVGYDVSGAPKYAALRSTYCGYKGEVTGSDKHYSFSMPEKLDAEHLHLFESAIDAMSFASLLELEGYDWKIVSLLSLAGVFKTKRKDVVPVALQQYLTDHLQVKTIHLHLDNDEVGRGATEGIINGLSDRYQVHDEPPKEGCKDVNDELRNFIYSKERRW